MFNSIFDGIIDTFCVGNPSVTESNETRSIEIASSEGEKDSSSATNSPNADSQVDDAKSPVNEEGAVEENLCQSEPSEETNNVPGSMADSEQISATPDIPAVVTSGTVDESMKKSVASVAPSTPSIRDTNSGEEAAVEATPSFDYVAFLRNACADKSVQNGFRKAFYALSTADGSALTKAEFLKV